MNLDIPRSWDVVDVVDVNDTIKSINSNYLCEILRKSDWYSYFSKLVKELERTTNNNITPKSLNDFVFNKLSKNVWYILILIEISKLYWIDIKKWIQKFINHLVKTWKTKGFKQLFQILDTYQIPYKITYKMVINFLNQDKYSLTEDSSYLMDFIKEQQMNIEWVESTQLKRIIKHYIKSGNFGFAWKIIDMLKDKVLADYIDYDDINKWFEYRPIRWLENLEWFIKISKISWYSTKFEMKFEKYLNRLLDYLYDSIELIKAIEILQWIDIHIDQLDIIVWTYLYEEINKANSLKFIRLFEYAEELGNIYLNINLNENIHVDIYTYLFKKWYIDNNNFSQNVLSTIDIFFSEIGDIKILISYILNIPNGIIDIWWILVSKSYISKKSAKIIRRLSWYRLLLALSYIRKCCSEWKFDLKEHELVNFCNIINNLLKNIGENYYSFKMINDNINSIQEIKKISYKWLEKKLLFFKTGSTLIPLWTSWYMIRIIDYNSFEARKIALEANIPCEDILINPKTGKYRTIWLSWWKIAIFTKCQWECVHFYVPKSLTEIDSISQQIDNIKKQMLDIWISHWHEHLWNFVVEKNDLWEPIVRVIDLDRAKVIDKNPS